MSKFVYVVDWNKEYGPITKYNDNTGKREPIFTINTKIPEYSGTDFHWEYIYKNDNSRKIDKKIPKFKNYKWEILERFKHPKAGQYIYSEKERTINNWPDYKYPEEDLLVLASTHTKVDYLRCYIIISENGVSSLTPEQFADQQFNVMVESNLAKWNRKEINKENIKQIPKDIISVFYDKDDRVLIGSNVTRGLVSYYYLDGKFSSDGKPIFLYNSISYNGKGNLECPDPNKIKTHKFINDYFKIQWPH